MNLPVYGFLHAAPIDQVIVALAIGLVAYGIVRNTRESDGSGFLDMLVVLGFFVLAIGCMCFVGMGGAR